MVFRRLLSCGLLAALAFCIAPAWGQSPMQKPLGATAQQTPAYLKNAGIDQRLNSALPLSDHFIDEAGKDVTLSQYFGSKPVVMALVYYHCGMLCPQVLHGMAEALRGTGFKAGDQYDVLVASFDPADTTADSVEAKQHFLMMLGNAGTADGVHFLTGPQRSITDLARATGFHYVRVPGPDGKMDQFAHSSVIMIATPDGRLSKYLFGIEYQPRDVRLAIIQASSHHIGTLSDLVLLYCCNYSPSQGRYTVAILRILGLAGLASVIAVMAMLWLLSKKPKTTPVGV